MSDAFFSALTQRFRIRALGDRDRLRSALAANDRARIGSIAHALSGSAGTFGFPAIGTLAGALEGAVERGDDPEAAAEPLLAALDALA